MRHACKIGRSATEMHRGDDFMDQTGRLGSNDCGANDLTTRTSRDEFYKTVRLPQDHRFSVVVERISRHAKIDTGSGSFTLRQPHECDLWTREKHKEFAVVIGLFQGRSGFPTNEAVGVAHRDFGLLNGDVDDFMWSCGISGCENVRDARLLRSFDLKATILKDDPGIFQGESAQIRTTPEAIKNFCRFDGARKSFISGGERNGFSGRCALGSYKLGTGDNFDAEFRKAGSKAIGNVRIGAFQNMRAALENGDLGAERIKIIGELKADRAGTEDDEGFRYFRKIERGVAIEAAYVNEARHRRRILNAAGSNKKCPARDAAPVDLDRVRIHKNSIAVDKGKRAILYPIAAVAGEIFDEGVLPFDNPAGVDGDTVRFDAELRAFASDSDAIASSNKRFARHAPPQDAKSPEFFGTVNKRDTKSETRRRSRTVVSGAAGANDEKVEIETIGR